MATLSTAIIIFALASLHTVVKVLKQTPGLKSSPTSSSKLDLNVQVVSMSTSPPQTKSTTLPTSPTLPTPPHIHAFSCVKVLATYGEGPLDLDGADEGSGDPDLPGLVHMEEEQWRVTCSFGLMGHGNVGKNVIDGCIAPTELLTNAGPASSSTFDLELVDVTGRSLAGQDVHNGRTVQLRGVATGVSGVTGIRPVSCFAIDGVAAYAILRAGCGDGIVFPKDRGFITSGLTTLSPYFMAFEINFASTVTYKCHFVTCDEDCNGSSCPVERGRRSTSDCRQTDCGALRSKSLEATNILSQVLRRRK